MEPFATIDDLAARWRPLTPSEQILAGVLLGDASVIIRAELPSIDQQITGGVMDADLLRMVVCSMVKRAMLTPVDQLPVSAQSVTAGPFSTSNTFANPGGELYLTGAEKKRLGVGAQQMFSIDTTPAGGR